MNVEIYEAILKLDQHSTLKLNEARGACVFVHWGSVWITQQGDIRDHIVQSGESFPIAGSSKAIVTSLSDAGVSVMARCDEACDEHKAGNAVREHTIAEAVTDGNEHPVQDAITGATVLRRIYPGFQQVDRHVDYAHRLRARAFANALHRGWDALRRIAGASRELA